MLRRLWGDSCPFNTYVSHDRWYPNTINFYEDEEWAKLRDLIDDFKEAI